MHHSVYMYIYWYVQIYRAIHKRRIWYESCRNVDTCLHRFYVVRVILLILLVSVRRMSQQTPIWRIRTRITNLVMVLNFCCLLQYK